MLTLRSRKNNIEADKHDLYSRQKRYKIQGNCEHAANYTTKTENNQVKYVFHSVAGAPELE